MPDKPEDNMGEYCQMQVVEFLRKEEQLMLSLSSKSMNDLVKRVRAQEEGTLHRQISLHIHLDVVSI